MSTYSQSPYVKKPSHHSRNGEHRKPHWKPHEVHGVRRWNLDQFGWSKSWYPNGTLSSSCLMDGSFPHLYGNQIQMEHPEMDQVRDEFPVNVSHGCCWSWAISIHMPRMILCDMLVVWIVFGCSCLNNFDMTWQNVYIVNLESSTWAWKRRISHSSPHPKLDVNGTTISYCMSGKKLKSIQVATKICKDLAQKLKTSTTALSTTCFAVAFRASTRDRAHLIADDVYCEPWVIAPLGRSSCSTQELDNWIHSYGPLPVISTDKTPFIECIIP